MAPRRGRGDTHGRDDLRGAAGARGLQRRARPPPFALDAHGVQQRDARPVRRVPNGARLVDVR
jgi:hypothetical protein